MLIDILYVDPTYYMSIGEVLYLDQMLCPTSDVNASPYMSFTGKYFNGVTYLD